MKTFSPARQRGAGTLDVMIGIIVGLVILGGVAAVSAQYSDAQTDKATADWMTRWATGGGTGGGAQRWLRDNAAACATGCTATHAQLASGGYLGVGFPATDPYGHTASLRVVPDAQGRLQGLVCASGGATPTGSRKGRIAGYMGFAGGYTPPSDPSIVKGPAWGPVSLASYGLAPNACSLVIALFVADQATLDDYLHRSATPGHPELNRMATDIDMGGHGLANATDVKFQAAGQGLTFFGGGEKIVGSADYGISFLTNNGTERMRLYNDGHLGLNSYITVPGGNGLSVGGSWYYGDGTNMALRTAANGGTVFLQGTAGGGGTAHLNVAGNVTGNEIYSNSWFRVNGGANGIYWQQFGGGWYMADGTWMRSYGDKSIYTGGQMQAGSIQSNSTITAAGRISSNEFILPAGGANVGWGCDRNGLIAQKSDGTGSLLNCVNGVWKQVGAGSHNPVLVADVVNQTVNGHNYSDSDMFVTTISNGYNCGNLNNDYNAFATVNGLQVASSVNNNTDSYKQASMAFMVPANGNYQVVYGGRYKCNTRTQVIEYR